MPQTREERGLLIIDKVVRFCHKEMRKRFLWHQKATQQTAAPTLHSVGSSFTAPWIAEEDRSV